MSKAEDIVKEAEQEEEYVESLINGEIKETKKSVKKNEEENLVYTSFLETPEFILEQIGIGEHSERSELSAREAKFILFEKGSKNSYEVVDEFEYKKHLYKPKTNKTFMTGSILLPSDVEEYGTTAELVTQIRSFFEKYFEVPKFYEKVLPYLILFYWLSDKFPFVPYIHFIGLTGTGKSTAMEVFGSISYKSIDASGSLSFSSIFRLANDWKGTLLIDEFDLGAGEVYRQMIQLLKAGVSDRPTFRTEGEKKLEPAPYFVKSPKIFASQQAISEAALESRIFSIKMSKNTRPVPLFRLNKFYIEAKEIRNKLLLWRLRNYTKVNLEAIEYGTPELMQFDGRVQQILTPIHYLSDKRAKKELETFAIEQDIETKRARLEEEDGIIFQYIFQHCAGDISITAITEHVNKHREKDGYKSKRSEKKIGKIVRKELQFETTRKNDGYYLVIDQKKIKELAKYYGLKEKDLLVQSSLSSQSSLNDEEEIDI